jgi:hypothetical protein
MSASLRQWGEAADIDLVNAVAAAGEADVGLARLVRTVDDAPMTDTVSGVVMCCRRFSRRSTVLITSDC